jgi:hypothetical protein
MRQKTGKWERILAACKDSDGLPKQTNSLVRCPSLGMIEIILL